MAFRELLASVPEAEEFLRASGRGSRWVSARFPSSLRFAASHDSRHRARAFVEATGDRSMDLPISASASSKLMPITTGPASTAPS
jgi:hypothetical protein